MTEASTDFLAECEKKIRHGVPGLSIKEQRQLFRIASGKSLPNRKRCKRCNANGQIDGVVVGGMTFHSDNIKSACPACFGVGYFAEDADQDRCPDGT